MDLDHVKCIEKRKKGKNICKRMRGQGTEDLFQIFINYRVYDEVNYKSKTNQDLIHAILQ